ncbi:5-methylcytosine restriction system specificity protein McrC [Chryseobacterium sp. EZn1]|uniref:5-methylcytosine restriction system specificity protein McrC n=1 Tax=Chryseobacterium cupriresistens TaxID=3366770 RepID=UPI0039855BAE
MLNDYIHIEAFDCLPFSMEKVSADVLQAFISSQSESVFWFSKEYCIDEDSKLAEYDYKNHCWIAGRFVGEAIFSFQNQDYKITIKPRFGEKMLFRMLEEIFNIRITSSISQANKNNWQHYIKRIIAFIWLQKLANANLHGLPKVHIKKEHRGQIIRGRLDVRKSIKPYYQSNEIVSAYRERQIDKTIAQIIFQAYNVLKTEFAIGQINIPDSALEALNQVRSTIQSKKHISYDDYRKISYKEIYLGWKPIVDLSWDIIQRKQISLKQDKNKKGFGFFIDMAEVWEQYLKAILKRNLSKIGWQCINEKQIAYPNHFYKRELIPDLVFQKGDEIAIWDAKYKKMLGRRFDVDRSDFFQIHTYIQNFLNHKFVKVGGLLYPISNRPDFNNYKSPYLINERGAKVNFIIDGIELTEEIEIENPIDKEQEFINRIVNVITV